MVADEGTRGLTVQAHTEISEKQWQATVVELARTLGFRVFHPYDARRSAIGWPDLCLVGRKIIWLELKSATGKTTPAQDGWIAAIRKAGGEAYVLRPSDLDLLGGILTERRTG